MYICNILDAFKTGSKSEGNIKLDIREYILKMKLDRNGF